MLELVVEKCLLCCEGGIGSLSPGRALRRVFECIASGVLLSGEKFEIYTELGNLKFPGLENSRKFTS